MDTVKLARAAMTDSERTEYEQISETLAPDYLAVTKRIYISMCGGLILLGAAFGVCLATMGPLGPWVIAWCVAFGLVLFGGLFAAPLAEALTRKRLRLRRAELLAAAASRVPDPRTRRPAPDDWHDDADWGRYPVTGVYDPATYYARGGRSTARAMQAWGDIDYETYRSNIE